MKKFKYKLDPLLKIRKFQEKKEFLNYAKVLGEVNRHKQAITEAMESRNNFSNQERVKMRRGEFNLAEKKTGLEFYRNIAALKVNSEKKIESMKDENDRLRKKAEDARRSRRVLEILREKKYSEYQTEQIKLEFKDLDEFNQRKREP
ncbi:MAG: flagellar FliJ family protein [Spirochaetia bacterium]|nr:flagellar FliJ family protein [Spirochaetia bacterium]